MSLLDTLMNSATLANPPEWLSDAFGARPTASGVSVTPDSAMRVSTVYACIQVLAQSVGMLPLQMFRRNADGSKEKAPEHPLYSILHALPNSEMTSVDMRELQVAQLAMRGTNINRIYRDRAGRVGELIPLQADTWRLDRNSRQQLVCETTDQGTLTHEQIWRISGLGSNGLTGYSPIALAREAIGLAMATEQHGATLFGNGAHPIGVLQTEGGFKDGEAVERLRNQFKERYSGKNAHKPLLLERGLEWKQMALSSEDAQFLDTRKFQRSEICALYRVPPHMVADLEKATFSNIEHQDLAFVRHTLMPWLVRIEKSIYRDLLTPDERKIYFASFNVEGLQRGDTKSRYESYGMAIKDGWMNRNEPRERENLNRVDGLDEYLYPLNMGRNDEEETDNAE